MTDSPKIRVRVQEYDILSLVRLKEQKNDYLESKMCKKDLDLQCSVNLEFGLEFGVWSLVVN